jgi:hypothetical protein
MKIHPIRAALAISSWGITGYMLIVGLAIPEAWWTIVGGVSVFYFTGTREG